MDEMRSRAFSVVLAKDPLHVRWIVPPRWAVRNEARDCSTSPQATSKYSRFVTIWAICESVEEVLSRVAMLSLMCLVRRRSSDFGTRI